MGVPVWTGLQHGMPCAGVIYCIPVGTVPFFTIAAMLTTVYSESSRKRGVYLRVRYHGQMATFWVIAV